jgi:hypothetical protein
MRGGAASRLSANQALPGGALRPAHDPDLLRPHLGYCNKSIAPLLTKSDMLKFHFFI